MLARLLLALSSLLIVAAVAAGYVRYELLSRDEFSDRAVAALEDDDVRAVLAREITDRVVLRTEPDLVAAKPLIEAAVAGIAGSEPFLNVFEDGIGRAHHALLSGDSRVRLDLQDVGVLVESTLGRLPVRGLDRIQHDVAVQLAFVNDVTRTAARTAENLRIAAYVLIALAILSALGAVLLSPDRRHALQILGFSVTGMALAAATVLAVVRVGVVFLVSEEELDRQAAGAVWDAFLGDLLTLLVLVAAFATIVAAAVATRVSLPSLLPALADGWRVVSRPPRRTVWRVARALGFVVVGVLILAEPLVALRVLALAIGLFVLYVGIAEFLALARARRVARAEIGHRDLVASLAPIGVGVLAVGALFVFLRSGGTTAPAVVRTAACNGHVELCDRQLDQVTLPATHNAMAASLAGNWYAATQTLTIRDQLRAGVRALLIDAHYGLQAGKDVRTDLSQRAERAGNADRALYLRTLGPAGLAAIQRIRDRIVEGEGAPGVFLCHRFCELGATELTGALREVREFLVERPDEVLVIVIQDYVLPADIVSAFERSGLDERVYRGPPAGPFPTLREMIDSEQQVVVYAENHGGGAPWYTAGFERAIEETPYTFKEPGLLTDRTNWAASCAPNRGTDTAPLLLVNHWVNTDPRPLPSNAGLVNRRDVLVGRARTCARNRGQAVNLLGVDFVGEGDVVGAADALSLGR